MILRSCSFGGGYRLADAFWLAGRLQGFFNGGPAGEIGLDSRNNVAVVVRGLFAQFRGARKQMLDAIQGFQEKRNGDSGRRRAVAQRIDQGFGGVSDVLEATQTKKTGGSLDGMHKPEYLRHRIRIRWVLFKENKIVRDAIDMIGSLAQEIAQQVIHG